MVTSDSFFNCVVVSVKITHWRVSVVRSTSSTSNGIPRESSKFSLNHSPNLRRFSVQDESIFCDNSRVLCDFLSQNHPLSARYHQNWWVNHSKKNPPSININFRTGQILKDKMKKNTQTPLEIFLKMPLQNSPVILRDLSFLMQIHNRS